MKIFHSTVKLRSYISWNPIFLHAIKGRWGLQKILYSLLSKTLLYWAHCLHEFGVTDARIVDDKSCCRAQIQILTLLIQAFCTYVHVCWVQNMLSVVPTPRKMFEILPWKNCYKNKGNCNVDKTFHANWSENVEGLLQSELLCFKE